jgi:hypothetical protein
LSRIRLHRAARLGALAAIAGALVACETPAWFAPEPEPGPLDALVFEPPSDLPAPPGLSATSGLHRRIPLQWDPVLLPGVGGYLVESSDAREGEFVARAALADRGTLAWVDEGGDEAPLGDGETRFYRLRSFDRAGRVSAIHSDVAPATTASLPAPPTGLRAYSQQPRSIPLVWRASDDPGVTGYTVERSPGPDGPFEVVAELEGRHTTHLLDAGLGDLRVLHYRVSSRNAADETGPPTEVLRAVTKPAPLPPIGLRVVGQRLGAVTLAWEPNVEDDLEAYRLLRWREGEDEPTPVGEVAVDQTRAEDDGVGAGEIVTYGVTAIDRDGLESRVSVPVQAAGVTYEWSATASAGGVRLRWNPRSDEGFVGARITRSRRPWGAVEHVVDGAELLDRDVVRGLTYRYVIELARADGSFAPPSQTIEVEIPEVGAGFVEIQPPASRLPPPEGVPR